jgi:hypothetical protein
MFGDSCQGRLGCAPRSAEFREQEHPQCCRPCRVLHYSGDNRLCSQPGEPSGVSAAEPACRPRYDRNLAIELAHRAHLPLKTGRRFSTKALLASLWSSVIAVRA